MPLSVEIFQHDFASLSYKWTADIKVGLTFRFYARMDVRGTFYRPGEFIRAKLCKKPIPALTEVASNDFETSRWRTFQKVQKSGAKWS